MGVWSLLVDGNRLRVGGEFNRVGNASIGRYTTFVTQVAEESEPGPRSEPAR